MERKESTPIRENRRRYEENHREERKAKCRVWGTSIDRSLADEIEEFLLMHKLTNVAIITAGFEALKEQYEP